MRTSCDFEVDDISFRTKLIVDIVENKVDTKMPTCPVSFQYVVKIHFYVYQKPHNWINSSNA